MPVPNPGLMVGKVVTKRSYRSGAVATAVLATLARILATTGRGPREHGLRERLAIWRLRLSLSGEHSAVGRTAIWGSYPEKPRQRARALPPSPHPPHRTAGPRSAGRIEWSTADPRASSASTSPALSATPLPQPPQRTAGPRSAGRIERSDGTGGAGALPPSEMRDKPGACGTSLGFSGGHSSVDRTPYGVAPLKSHVSEHEPSALHRALPPSPRRGAPPVRDPLAGSHGATDRGRVVPHGMSDGPGVCGTGLGFLG